MANEPIVIDGEHIISTLNVEGGAVSNFKRLPPLQAAGMWLALGVGVISLIVMIGLGVEWQRNTPAAPVFPSNLNGLDQQTITNITALLEQYKIASEIALDGPLKLFDRVVASTLAPIFTAILGYIFGTHTKQARDK